MIEGWYEYRADGDYYRSDSSMDAELYPMMDTVIAYDGDRFQMLLGEPSTLTLGPEGVDSDALVMALPNPLFELVTFLDPLTDQTVDRRTRLKDIRSIASDTTIADDLDWEMVEEDGATIERATLPGGTFEDGVIYQQQIEYTHHVYAIPGERNKPVRIDRVSADDDETIGSTTFSHYQQYELGDQLFFWPKYIDIVAFDPDGSQFMKVSFVIRELDINAEIDDGLFTIDWSEAERVWDAELGMFVQP